MEETHTGTITATPEEAVVDVEKQTTNTENVEVQQPAQPPAKKHPREGMSGYSWALIQLMFIFSMIIAGYDVSNIANIQPPIYEAFGNVQLLPWVAVGYSVLSGATIPVVRKVSAFVPLKILYLVSSLIIIVGAVASGAASSMNAVIIGRVLTGMAAACQLTLGTLYNFVLTTPAEYPRIQGLNGMGWALGLILGPIIGGAFAENAHATWRWAMYINVPVLGTVIPVLFWLLPPLQLESNAPLLQRFLAIDWLGSFLHATSFILLCLVLIFSGSTWAWDSGASIAVWVLAGVMVSLYMVQQLVPLFTTKDRRIFPVTILTRHRSVVLIFISTSSAASAYGVTLYYTPLFFAFTRGFSPLEASVRLLPYICTFIVFLILATQLLPVVRVYGPFYVLGGALVMIGTGLQTAITPSTSTARVMGADAIIGAGLGMVWQTGAGVMPRLMGSPGPKPTSKEEAVRQAIFMGVLRQDCAASFFLAQMLGLGIALSIAGCVFQNVGYSLLQEAIGGTGLFTAQNLREMLAGVDSVVWTSIAGSNPEILVSAVAAATKVIARLQWIPFVGGAVIFVCGLAMKWEPVDFTHVPVPSQAPEAAPAEAGNADGSEDTSAAAAAQIFS